MKSVRRQKAILAVFISLSVFMILMNMAARGPEAHIVQITTGLDLDSEQGLGVTDKITALFNTSGLIVSGQGVEQTINSTLQVSLVHSYSPYTENRFRAMMIDPSKKEHRIFANSPAILQTDSGEVITVMRIWLDKEIWDLTSSKPHNSFQDNYFYIQRFDRYMRPITKGSVLGIPTPVQWTVGDGPIEPRIFEYNNTIYLTFNTGLFTSLMKPLDSTFIWDLTNSEGLMPKIRGGQPMLDYNEGFPRDKHWSALTNDSKLYFIYNLDPLRVIDCRLKTDDTRCHFVHKEGPDSYIFKDTKDALRGGTPFVLYKYPYYVSVAHGTFFRNCSDIPTNACHGQRYYTTHLIVMTIEPDFKILYISDNIPYPKETLEIPIVRYRFIPDPFFFPVGLILENYNSLVLGGHVNDHSSVLYRIRGFQSAIDNAISFHKSNPTKPGPKLGLLNNQIRNMAEKFSGYRFADGKGDNDILKE